MKYIKKIRELKKREHLAKMSLQDIHSLWKECNKIKTDLEEEISRRLKKL